MSGMTRLPVDDVAGALPEVIDVFIACASFESRCLTLAEHIPGYKVRQAILCENDSLASLTTEFSQRLTDRFANVVTRLVFRRNDPLDVADKLQGALANVAGSGRVIFVDITTFTHEALLILVRLLQLYRRLDDRVYFGYTVATEYSVGAEGGDKWLSKGISEIRSILGYPGENLPSRRVHLLILTGFETERAAKLVDEFEPALVSLGFVTGADTDEIHQLSSRAFQQSFLEKYSSAEVFRFPCYDALATKDAILHQAHRFAEFNLVVAAMNTKISTVGAALAAAEDDRIQLCYAFANEYNYAGYSAPGTSCYVGDVTDLLAATATPRET